MNTMTKRELQNPMRPSVKRLHERSCRKAKACSGCFIYHNGQQIYVPKDPVHRELLAIRRIGLRQTAWRGDLMEVSGKIYLTTDGDEIQIRLTLGFMDIVGHLSGRESFRTGYRFLRMKRKVYLAILGG